MSVNASICFATNVVLPLHRRTQEEEDEEDQRDEPGRQPDHVLERAHARLHRGAAVLPADHLDAFVRKTRGIREEQRDRALRIRAELLERSPGVREHLVHPLARACDDRRSVLEEVHGLSHDERPAEPNHEAQRQQDGEQHQHERQRGVPAFRPDPFVIRLEQQGEEKPHDHRRNRRRGEGKELDGNPPKGQGERHDEGKGQHRDRNRHGLPLGWGKINHACIVAKAAVREKPIFIRRSCACR